MLNNIPGIQILEYTPPRVERKVPAWLHLFFTICFVLDLALTLIFSNWIASFGMLGVFIAFLISGILMICFEATSANDIPEEYRISVSQECSVKDWSRIEEVYDPKFIEDVGENSVFRLIRRGLHSLR
ncbi:MAG: hypothetical protein IJZ68_09315 [Bacteroidaceae bacterium]|nr:hypothetical protein [Bacteroidaceae bacterium]